MRWTTLATIGLALAPRLGTKAVRELLADLVSRSPGINEVGIGRETGLRRSSVRHHLRGLVSAGVIQQHPVRRENHYFQAGTPPATVQAQSAVAHGRARQVLREILLDPGIPQRELAARVGMSRKTLGEYVDFLGERGLLSEVRDSRFQRYFPGEDLEQALVPLGGRLEIGADLQQPRR